MPLFTYVTSYNGAFYTSQSRRSNYLGSPDWIEPLPVALKTVLKTLGPRIYAGFDPVSNRQNLWRKNLTIEDGELVVFVIQSDG